MKQLILPAVLKNLEAMMALITDEAKSLGFDEKKLYHIKLAAEEVLVNIINYAYPDKHGDIELTVSTRGHDGIEVVVVDRGIVFDPLSLPEPDIHASMEKRKIGGLGVFLVRKLMDEVTYRREEDRNILTFVKFKNPQKT